MQVLWAEQQHEKTREKRGHYHDMMVRRGLVPRFQDPLWDEQWYLVSCHERLIMFTCRPASYQGKCKCISKTLECRVLLRR